MFNMSCLARITRSSQAVRGVPTRSMASFHTFSARRALSESDRDAHKSDEDHKSKIDQHKHDSVSRAKDGKGEWKPELSTRSEQDVAGDKTDLSMKEMEKLGEQKGKEDK